MVTVESTKVISSLISEVEKVLWTGLTVEGSLELGKKVSSMERVY